MSFNIDQIKKEYKELSKKLVTREVISDHTKLKEISKKHAQLKETLGLHDRLEKLEKNIAENKNIIKSTRDAELKSMAQEESDKLAQEQENLTDELSDLLDPTSGAKVNEVIMEIRAGVGGDEASLFAQDLFRMYTRYSEINGWKIDIIDESRSELKGLKEVTLEIAGKGVYKKLKNESGVHRVQRIPTTEKSGRLHTSSASVAVFPKAKSIDIEIKPADIKLETFRSSGPGGQNVNKVSTAVRITHLPSGLSVASQSSKKQAQNREIAMTLLRSRLLQQKQEEKEKKIKKERKGIIGSGDRSEKIRTYNFPQNRVTDHRINKNWHGINSIMDGALDPIFDELNKKL